MNGAPVARLRRLTLALLDALSSSTGAAQRIRASLEADPQQPLSEATGKTLMRSLFTVSQLCQHFDFDSNWPPDRSDVASALPAVRVRVPLPWRTGPEPHGSQGSIKEAVCDILVFFSQRDDLRMRCIAGLGSVCIRWPRLILHADVRSLYAAALVSDDVKLQCQVLKNLQSFLEEEDARIRAIERQRHASADGYEFDADAEAGSDSGYAPPAADRRPRCTTDGRPLTSPRQMRSVWAARWRKCIWTPCLPWLAIAVIWFATRHCGCWPRCCARD